MLRNARLRLLSGSPRNLPPPHSQCALYIHQSIIYANTRIEQHYEMRVFHWILLRGVQPHSQLIVIDRMCAVEYGPLDG